MAAIEATRVWVQGGGGAWLGSRQPSQNPVTRGESPYRYHSIDMPKWLSSPSY